MESAPPEARGRGGWTGRRLAARVSRPGEAALDRWSWVHLASGVAVGFLLGTWWMALGALVVYELFEGGLRRIKLRDGGLFEHESWPNVVADVVVGMAGYVAVRVAGAPSLVA